MAPLDSPITYVTGKGGVGKTTVAAALGLRQAEAGRRTIVVEVGGHNRIARLIGGTTAGEGEEVQVAPGLWSVSIDPVAALKEWLTTQVGGAVSKVLFRGHMFENFVAAAPGAKELVTITKVWELSQEARWKKSAKGYERVVVDAPASGHGVALLRTARTYGDIARVGPIRQQADKVWDTLQDRERTSYLAVATPSELPVTETLELDGALDEAIGRPLDGAVVNGLLPKRFDGPQLESIDAARASLDGGAPAAAWAGRAAHAIHDRGRSQRRNLDRLRRELDVPVLTLPFVFTEALVRGDVEELAATLEQRAARL